MIVTTQEISSYFERLFPITRSITGAGNRQTLLILQEIIPLKILEYPSGKKVYDWDIPLEWNIRNAWIKNDKGEKIIDYLKCNLHILNYSVPINKVMNFFELKEHLYFLCEQPDVIPYKTSYYKRNWGFCLTYNDYLELFNENEEYEVFIDSELKQGYLTLADYVIEGHGDQEFIFSTYFCHPSLANDNLSGILACAFLAREISGMKLRNTYRFIFCPETIGTITYIAEHAGIFKGIKGGYILTCLAGPGQFGYKQSYLGNSLVDRAVYLAFKEKGIVFINYPFIPQGSDERQYSSPGLRIPIGSIHKDKYHEYKEYHTSADNLDFVSSESLLTGIQFYLSIIENLESDIRFISRKPICEPKLDKYGLYPNIGRRFIWNQRTINNIESHNDLDIILWLLFYADGEHSLLEIAEKHGFNLSYMKKILFKLSKKGLIKIL